MSPLTDRPVIAVTMGDPAGVGPELCLRLLTDAATARRCVPVVFGDAAVLRAAALACGLPAPRRVLNLPEFDRVSVTQPAVVDLACCDGEPPTPGRVSAAAGAAALAFIEAAIDRALAGRVDAVTTAPIHKEAIALAGAKFPGHTELFAERTRADRVVMMLTAPEITCSLVTAHVGYRDVPALLSVDRVEDVIVQTAAAMRRMNGREPRLALCGLNPHAGEHGLFGDGEEQRYLEPALARARRAGIVIDGPLPPDTAFLPRRRAVTDAYVCLYHDQGLIPLKALAFDEAVNVTLGLPIVRTSVDHGTAFDIAWQGRAAVGSLLRAVELATRLVRCPG